ncbi:cyclic AMP-dependent transcription factor ATF-6 alpha [Episyrphus balteatus]|uniref:cyclic AMP-dependent transcription factor ATF-6 alpha n=1 Tax=Episyrphus balteatus TaxID=286459 RepID=UPI0024854D31|nr:cyclic AMP-dependent transcription factor ATF-6 alpha [Episyrphus balteatus]
MDFDSCNQLYEDFPSLMMTPEYNIDELDEILRSTDANLSSGLGYTFPTQPSSVPTTFPSPPASSTSNCCENLKSDCDSPSDFNPDDFINFFSDEDSDGKSTKYANRNTPSPTNSSSSGTSSGDSVQSMIVDTPPISPPSSVFQLPANILPITTCPTPINILQGTLIPVKTVPLTPVQVQSSRTPIKISPKPPTMTNTTNTSSKPKTIVLSSTDFKALMQKMQNGKGNSVSMPKIILKTAPSTPIQQKPSVLPKAATANTSSTEFEQATNKPRLGLKGIIDERHLKKQQRMIKNRESASLSRKKKKDYVVSLESRINDLEKENTTLKGENTTLRSQLIAFAQTCQCSHLKISEFITNKLNSNTLGNTCHTKSTFKSRLMASNMKKNTAVLLAMVFMVSINFGSFHTYFSQDDIMQSPRVDFEAASMYTGRRGLLWFDDETGGNITKPIGGRIKISENDTNSTESDDKCPVSINQTENLRLAGELRKWIVVNDYLNLSSVQEEPRKFKLTPEFLELKSMSQPIAKSEKPNSKRNRKNYFNRQLLRNKKIQEHSKNSLKVYGPQIDDEYLRLFQEIKRRDDTFYVLSFNSDHILLPAAAYNKSTRPKMALMLPAGDPSISGEITLMQIDCEVLNTTEVQLKSNMIPSNLRPKFNFHTPNPRDVLNKTGGGPEKRAARNAYDRTNGSEPKPTPFYRPYFMAAPEKPTKHEKNDSGNVKNHQDAADVDSIANVKGTQFIGFHEDFLH